MEKKRVIIIGAAGRDFHNFNVCYRDNTGVAVAGFTAAQIPGIANRIYPPSLAGKNYPEGIQIYNELDLAALIREHEVDEVVFSYSDVTYHHVMNLASIANSAGAAFKLLSPRQTMIKSKKPVVAVCAIRTGCGKSQTSRYIIEILRGLGIRTIPIRHPMPYDHDLASQAVQRFATLDDLKLHRCTIEEMEEYEPHIHSGGVIYAGVDFAAILAQAEKEANVIMWDGGNNDTSFYVPDLLIVVADALRPGHELKYYPGADNLRMADVIIINKVDSANPADVEEIIANAKRVNPNALIIQAKSPVTVDKPGAISGKRVLVIEDGPTCTHGGMKTGAGTVAALQCGAKIVDPRPYLQGSLNDTFRIYPEIGALLPAMGYGPDQIQDLANTVEAMHRAGEIEVVVIGTPIDLRRVIPLPCEAVRVSYELEEIGDELRRVLSERILPLVN